MLCRKSSQQFYAMKHDQNDMKNLVLRYRTPANNRGMVTKERRGADFEERKGSKIGAPNPDPLGADGG
jgi:hypothetical protein